MISIKQAWQGLTVLSLKMRGGGRQVSGTILSIDLTEERHLLLTDGAGHFVTLSVDARQNTNLEKLFFKRIEPFSSEHVRLVKAFLPSFARKISNLQGIEHIVIHRAFFAGTDSTTIHVNNCLKEFYDILAHHLTKCISIEVPKEMRVSGIMHKRGPYALHMVDEYYKYLLYLISRVLDLNIRINNNTSVQNLEESIFFSQTHKNIVIFSRICTEIDVRLVGFLSCSICMLLNGNWRYSVEVIMS